MTLKVLAAVLERFNGPFSIREVDLNVRPNDVVVNVKSVGVCGRDVVVWRGGFRNLRPPLILGHEVFGEVDGRPVAVFPAEVDEYCLTEHSGSENLCESYSILGEGRPGGYATRIAVPRWNLIELPDRDYDRYAAAACGVATFIHASKVAAVTRESRVLVTGATGGVGIHGVQYLSKVVGAEVYAYARNLEKAKALEGLGVHTVTDFSFYKKEGRVDAVIEVVGGPTINNSILALRPQGTLVLVGNVTGEEIRLQRPALVVMRELKITGSAAYTKAEYEEAIRLIHEGLIRPFYRAYRLEEVNEAYRDIVEGRVLGRAVLRP